jgi:hypothetical protein
MPILIEAEMHQLAAREKVFALLEIFEAILFELPLRDLLVHAQLVSHTWNTTIQSSTLLQQHLFLLPAQPSTSPPKFNPLLHSSFPPWFEDNTHNRYNRGAEFKTLDWNSTPKKQLAYARKEASWRKMLLCQPPVHVLLIEKNRYSMGGDWHQEGSINFEDGVRMGFVYDRAYEVVRRPISAFSMNWDGGEEDAVTLITHFTTQCESGMCDDVGSEFCSEAFEKGLEIEFKDVKGKGKWTYARLPNS